MRHVFLIVKRNCDPDIIWVELLVGRRYLPPSWISDSPAAHAISSDVSLTDPDISIVLLSCLQ